MKPDRFTIYNRQRLMDTTIPNLADPFGAPKQEPPVDTNEIPDPPPEED